MNEFDITRIAFDIYNNWESALEIIQYHKNGKLYYDNAGKLFIQKEGKKPTLLDSLDHDILMFMQTQNINLDEMTIDDFSNKYLDTKNNTEECQTNEQESQ